MSFIQDVRRAAANLAKPTLAVDELPPVAMPATTGGVAHELQDLGLTGDGAREYAALLVTNNSDDTVTLRDCWNNAHTVQAGQTFEWTRPRGCQWLSITPTATTTLGQVTYVPKVRFRDE